jgi:hypothetical protein
MRDHLSAAVCPVSAVMTAYVIMHNMIVEKGHDDSVYDQGWDFQHELVAPNPGPTLFREFLHAHHDI